ADEIIDLHGLHGIVQRSLEILNGQQLHGIVVVLCHRVGKSREVFGKSGLEFVKNLFKDSEELGIQLGNLTFELGQGVGGCLIQVNFCLLTVVSVDTLYIPFCTATAVDHVGVLQFPQRIGHAVLAQSHIIHGIVEFV